MRLKSRVIAGLIGLSMTFPPTVFAQAAMTPDEAAAAYVGKIEAAEPVARMLAEVDNTSRFTRMQLIEAMKANDWSEAERDRFFELTSDAFSAVDARNDEIVKEVLARWSWDELHALHPRFAEIAWTAVNHSSDAEWQREIVQDGSRLVSEGIIGADSFANVNDRVLLEAEGRQQYGTQIVCEGGAHVPDGGKPAGSFDAARAEIGLGPMSAYIASITEMYGACPAEG